MYKKIYTTGVFDCLHIGHVRLLKEAKKQCYSLLVGVSSDELVKVYKKKNPIQPLEERLEIVSSIRYVDEVSVQHNRDNKLDDALSKSCDCIAVGDDWKGSEIFINLERDCSKVGISILYLPYTKGISSTKIRGIINNNNGSSL